MPARSTSASRMHRPRVLKPRIPTAWIGGGVVGTIELLARSLRTGGIILIGEPYWRQLAPTEEAAKGCLANSISDFLMLPCFGAGWVECIDGDLDILLAALFGDGSAGETIDDALEQALEGRAELLRQLRTQGEGRAHRTLH